MMSLTKLAAELHEAAVKKGFWDVEDAYDKHIAKMFSELGEVVQADRAGIMYEVEREGAKPEGVAAELADFVMMLLDLLQYENSNIVSILEGVEIEDCANEAVKDAKAYVLVNTLHEAVSDVALTVDKTPSAFYSAAAFCVHAPATWLECRGYNLWDIIRAKMEYNKSRPALHGREY